MSNYKVYISLPDALRAMDKLAQEDISWNGEDYPGNFDAKAAKKKLNELTKYEGYIKPVRCKICLNAITSINQDGLYGDTGFKIHGCKKNPGGYLGDEGYCSLGEIDPAKVIANMANKEKSQG